MFLTLTLSVSHTGCHKRGHYRDRLEFRKAAVTPTIKPNHLGGADQYLQNSASFYLDNDQRNANRQYKHDSECDVNCTSYARIFQKAGECAPERKPSGVHTRSHEGQRGKFQKRVKHEMLRRDRVSGIDGADRRVGFGVGDGKAEAW